MFHNIGLIISLCSKLVKFLGLKERGGIAGDLEEVDAKSTTAPEETTTGSGTTIANKIVKVLERFLSFILTICVTLLVTVGICQFINNLIWFSALGFPTVSPIEIAKLKQIYLEERNIFFSDIPAPDVELVTGYYFNNKYNAAFNRYDKKIYLNTDVFFSKSTTELKKRQIIRHELTHAWVFSKGLDSYENDGHNVHFFRKAYYCNANYEYLLWVYPNLQKEYNNLVEQSIDVENRKLIENK